MRKFFLLVLAMLVIPASAQAFSAKGHKLIARLAYERLTPQAQSDVNTLLALAAEEDTPQCPASTLEDAAVWADCVRKSNVPQFSEINHYEWIPLCDTHREPPCANGDCLSQEIERSLNTLRTTSGATVQRLEALEFVIHLVGDAHQPLHTIEAWGNTGHKIKVSYPGEGRGRTLHQIWDRELVLAALDNGGLGTIQNLINQNASSWASGTPEAWVQESHDVGVRAAYGPLALNGCGLLPSVQVITPNYIADNAKVEQQQIAKAAVRLAWVLNSVLH